MRQHLAIRKRRKPNPRDEHASSVEVAAVLESLMIQIERRAGLTHEDAFSQPVVEPFRRTRIGFRRPGGLGGQVRQVDRDDVVFALSQQGGFVPFVQHVIWRRQQG